jgi:hypothetical protein
MSINGKDRRTKYFSRRYTLLTNHTNKLLRDSLTIFASIATSGFNSVVTTLGFNLLTLVVKSGDKIGVFASINQKLIGQAVGIISGGYYHKHMLVSFSRTTFTL